MAISSQNAQFLKTVDYREPVYNLFQYGTQIYLELYEWIKNYAFDRKVSILHAQIELYSPEICGAL